MDKFYDSLTPLQKWSDQVLEGSSKKKNNGLPVYPNLTDKYIQTPFMIETEFGTSETRETKRSKHRQSKEKIIIRQNDHFGSNELMTKTYELLDDETHQQPDLNVETKPV